jgi:hypothetical protein
MPGKWSRRSPMGRWEGFDKATSVSIKLHNFFFYVKKGKNDGGILDISSFLV